VLVANLQYATMCKGRFLAVLHLLGDPIDSMLSLSSKVETWRRCYLGREDRSRYGAVITAGIDELVETFQPDFNRAQVGLILQVMLFRPDIQPRQLNDLVVDTASELADCRVNQTLRT
jgi:hypothetical protein